MFKKVLIADDLGSINKGVLSLLDKMGIQHVQSEQYCDSSYLKIKKALILDEDPYELLITDLSFKLDYRDEKYTSGEELIAALAEVQPSLKVIVYSVEDRLQVARTLINTYNIDAYVCKGRRGLEELEESIKVVYDNKKYLSPYINEALKRKSNLEMDNYDLLILKLLSNGLSQDDISTELKKSGVTPSSLSSVEKKLNIIKDQFKANNATHLVAIVKDLGLI